MNLIQLAIEHQFRQLPLLGCEDNKRKAYLKIIILLFLTQKLLLFM